MTLEEIKTKICDLRCSVEELQEESHKVWIDADQEHTESLAEFLDCELGYIAYRLGELEDLQIDSEGNPDTEGIEYSLQEWWDDASNEEKARLVGIPAPSRNDARGDEQCDFDDYCDKWWNAKTLAQKQEIYKDNMPWWELQDDTQ